MGKRITYSLVTTWYSVGTIGAVAKLACGRSIQAFREDAVLENLVVSFFFFFLSFFSSFLFAKREREREREEGRGKSSVTTKLLV